MKLDGSQLSGYRNRNGSQLSGYRNEIGQISRPAFNLSYSKFEFLKKTKFSYKNFKKTPSSLPHKGGYL